MNASEGSRYRIVSVIGRGGFGTVYRAVLEGPAGFTRDVAIKLLTDANPPPDLLERFRDEARILGLVRDRAVVHVEPPQKLGERWAVVMQLVDGVSLRRLIKGNGRLPPAIALRITQELARVLHRLWHQAGPDGQPLHLRHRDLKPDNVQITSDGSVMLLDFGIAKAEFSGREAQTRSVILGTEGYIAPERFFGNEGQKTDVFSLGVMLWEMLYGKRPARLSTEPPGDPSTALGAASALALELASLDEDERPLPREVERRCEELLRRIDDGESLRDWAEFAVPSQLVQRDDPLVGHVLSGTASQPTGAGTARVALLAGGTTAVVLGVAGAVGLALVVAIGGVAWLATTGPASAAPDPAPVHAPVAPATPEPDAPKPAPVEPEPAPVEPEPTVIEPEPAPAPTATPVKPARPSPAPEPTAPTWPIAFASLPPDAVVFVDGARVGTTPILGHTLREGRHTVTMEHDGRRITQTIEVGKRGSTRFIWRVAENRWEASR